MDIFFSSLKARVMYAHVVIFELISEKNDGALLFCCAHKYIVLNRACRSGTGLRL